jgi:hypothetical protein
MSGCQKKPPVALAVPSNTPQRLDFFYSANADCTSAGQTVVQVTSLPANGKAEVRFAKDYPNYPDGSPRKNCNMTPLDTTQIWYTPNPGFAGADSLKVTATFPSGPPQDFTYPVVVK